MAEDVKLQRFEIDTREKLDAWTGDIAAWNAWGRAHLGEDFEPLDPDAPVHPILKGEAAIGLWQIGRDKWNRWIGWNPTASVDFRGQTFEPNSTNFRGNSVIEFIGYDFPQGFVSFLETKFGDGDVDFGRTSFGKGTVNFIQATFGKGHINFTDTKFGEGNVSFVRTNFGEGSVSFTDAKFGEGSVSFNRAIFGDGYVRFDEAKFGEGVLSFVGTTFSDGILSFDDAILGKGNVDFRYSSFGAGKVSFANCAFDGTARFTDLKKVDGCALFSFEGCSFEKLFTFSHGGKMGGPIDLRRTKLAHTLVVADIHCDFVRGPQPDWSARLSNWLCAFPQWRHPESGYGSKEYYVGPAPAWKWRKKAIFREDSQRFRRLKELAVANRNHAKALEFHAREIQTARGHGTSALQDLGQFLYWTTSDYGRSVKRPLGWLVTVCIAWATFLWDLRQPVASFPNEVRQRLGEATPDFWTALIYSASNMLSFIPTGRTARTQGEVLLFGGFVPEYIIALNGVQTVLSVILLFLLSLGLRNMFRV